jgi:hypothetical protein
VAVRLDTRLRRWKQVAKSTVKRLLGRPQPRLADIAAAEARVDQGIAGIHDGGDPQRDRCLARGYCCEKGCRACPWGHGSRGTAPT